MSLEKIELIKPEIELDDLCGEMNESEKVKGVFQHLLNQSIKSYNLKKDIKEKKEEIKEADESPAELFQAVKESLEEKENKKLISAEIIETYKEQIEEGEEFQGLKQEIESLLESKNDISIDEKDILAKATSELGIDKKAIQIMVKEKLAELDPDKKNEEVDIATEGLLNEYKKML
jgi:hypothetical protein